MMETLETMHPLMLMAIFALIDAFIGVGLWTLYSHKKWLWQQSLAEKSEELAEKSSALDRVSGEFKKASKKLVRLDDDLDRCTNELIEMWECRVREARDSLLPLTLTFTAEQRDARAALRNDMANFLAWCRESRYEEIDAKRDEFNRICEKHKILAKENSNLLEVLRRSEQNRHIQQVADLAILIKKMVQIGKTLRQGGNKEGNDLLYAALRNWAMHEEVNKCLHLTPEEYQLLYHLVMVEDNTFRHELKDPQSFPNGAEVLRRIDAHPEESQAS